MANRKTQLPLAMSQIVSRISSECGVPKEMVSAAIRGLKGLVTTELSQGRTVDLGIDFGRFIVHTTAKRIHHVPTRDKPIKAGGNRKVKFIPSAAALKRMP